VGVAPIGLADGYLSHRPDSAPYALLGGRRVPIRGVSLEYISLDLSDFADARVGDEIVLLGRSSGEEILLADIARWRDCAPHEALMAFEGRLCARYVRSPQRSPRSSGP
jgi:alanine racemase